MKSLIAAVMLAFTVMSVQAGEPPKKEENTNCVKKDKAGKCPPLPNSPKPTPKKKAEAK
jgi:hypothetical protein